MPEPLSLAQSQSPVGPAPGASPRPTADIARRRPRLRTVALIGVDGSGKTTVARRLVESFPQPMTYLYMGASVESSNVTLPTSRFIHWWKVRRVKRSLKRSGVDVPEKVHLHGLEHRTVIRGPVASMARLVHRMAEESYRQTVSWLYQRRGCIVLYDRHFFFDCHLTRTGDSGPRGADRWHSWFLRRWYPRPELVVFLDAPVDTLYARKQEVPPDYLRSSRERLLSNSGYAKEFVRVDASQPIERVVDQVRALILERTT